MQKPKPKSLLGTLAVTVSVFIGSQTSAVVGYVLALSALVLIIVATLQMELIWPTRTKTENPLVFSLFWGLMIGLIGPGLITTDSAFDAGEIPLIHDR